jgi:hypothetical protein
MDHHPDQPTPPSPARVPHPLPTAALLVRGLGYVAAIGAFAALVCWFARPAGFSGVWTGSLAVGGAYLAGGLLIQPWTPRLPTQWPMLLLGMQGVVFALAVGAGLLLYSATRPDPLVFGLVVAAGFVAAQFGMASVYARVSAAHHSGLSG